MTNTGQVGPTRPNDDVQECLAANLRRTSRLVSQYYDSALRPYGVRITQFNLLAALSLSGPTTISNLAAAFGIDRTTLTRNIKVLEDQGHVEQTVGADQRTRVVRLTAAGRRLLARALPHWRVAHNSLREKLGDEFTATLDLLGAVEQAVTSGE